MKTYFLLVISLISFSLNGLAQTESPYKTSLKVDIPITLAGVGLSGLGVYFISSKDDIPIDMANRLAMSRNEVNSFDRAVAGNYSERARSISNIPFYGSFVMPLALLLDQDIYQNAPQVFLLYGETMAITGAFYAMTAGLTNRKRPLVYGTKGSLEDRMNKNSYNSFFAGHAAATAGATFFLAKVFHDFNPDSPARPYIWGAAAVIPAGVGYLRMAAGKHFLSDVIIGYTIGTGVGILVPQLHKKGINNLSLSPFYNPIEGNGMALNYTF